MRTRRSLLGVLVTVFALSTLYRGLPVREASAAGQRGVDVSSWQGSSINWQSVAASGVSFAYIRAAEGSSAADVNFRTNWLGASAAGVTPGAYLFFHPAQDPVAQANLLIRQLQSVGFEHGDLLPAVDVETTDNQSPSAVAASLRAMVGALQPALGMLPVIYTAPSWWDAHIGSSAFTANPLWVANWGVNSPGLPANGWGGNGWRVWQYSDAGSVPGIPGHVDADQAGSAPLPYYGTVGTVSPLPNSESSSTFNVCWTIGGPASHSILWTETASFGWTEYTDTTRTCTAFFGRPGETYDFSVQVFDPQGRALPVPQAFPQATTTISSSAASSAPFRAMYLVDGYGLLHSVSSAPIPMSTLWLGWDIVRGIAIDSDGLGGQILDGFGALHGFGNAQTVAVSAYWPYWNIARGVALRTDAASGYVLDGFGGVHPFGGAPSVTTTAYWPNWDIARAIVLRADGRSGYVLDGFGGLHPFASTDVAMPPVPTTAYWPNWGIANSVALRSDGTSGYTLDGFGGIHPFGGAPALSSGVYWPYLNIARQIVLMDDGGGYVNDGYGGVHAFGDAPPAATPFYVGRDVIRGAAIAP